MTVSQTPIDFLLNRASVKFVRGPGPDEAQLARILQTAMSAPDHARQQPWRFTLIQGDAVGRLADVSLSAMKDAGLPITPEKEGALRDWIAQVPLLIGIACKLDHGNGNVPDDERMLATGAAVTNMLNAAHMLGFGAFWSTGLGTYLEAVPTALGFDPLDYRFLGFLVLGTPIDAQFPVTRPDHRQFVSVWTGQ